MQVKTFNFSPTKTIPNSRLPLLYYPNAFPDNSTPSQIEAKFRSNGWIPQWRYGMYCESHYHSTTHEGLGVFRGNARIRFGISDDDSSDDGVELNVKVGDVIVIPAGVAHCALKESGGFCMVGSYPEGAEKWDMCYGGASEVRAYQEKIAKIAIPEMDPVGGKDGPLKNYWKQE